MKSIFPLVLIALFCLNNYTEAYAQNNMNIIAQFQGEHHTSKFGLSMASLDFNHDGYIDLVVGSPSYGYVYGSSPSRGKVYIYYGGPTFNSSTPASVTFEGTYNGTTGIRLNNVIDVGDVNGDGFDDLFINGKDSISTVIPHTKYINIYTGGTTTPTQPDIAIPYNWELHHDLDVVSRLGDINNDGFDDIGVGIFTSSYAVDFYVIWGGSFVWQYVITSWPGIHSWARGFNGIGDINDDAYDDFSIGYSSDYTGLRSTLITLYYGNMGGTIDSTEVLIQTNTLISQASVPIGDVNGDGFSDFVGYANTSVLNAWLGSLSLSLSPSLTLSPNWQGDESGESLIYGDVNNDGFDDVVGANYNFNQFSLWLGRTQFNGVSDLIVTAPSVPYPGLDYFGVGLTMGDYNADGYCDIAVSAPFTDYSFATDYRGYVYIYAGNGQLADTTVANEDNSIPSHETGIKVTISPNPCSVTNNIKLQVDGLDKNEIGSVEIYNIKGQRVVQATDLMFAAKSSLNTIQLKNMTSGLYLCQIRLSDKIIVRKLSYVVPLNAGSSGMNCK